MTSARFAQWLVQKRWWIIAASVLFALFAASGGRFIEFSNSYRVFFSKENPQLQAFEALQNTYTKTDNVLFVVAPKDEQVFTRDTLTAIEMLTQAAWHIPYSSRVDSITNFQHTSASNDELTVRDLVQNAASLSGDDLARIKDIALHEPLLLHRLIAPRADVTGVNVTVILPEKSLAETPEVMAAARKLAKDIEAKYPHIKIYVTGMVPMNNAFSESSQHDLATLVPLMYAAIVFITFMSLRSVTGTLATVLVIVFSVMAAMGITGWLGINLSPPSASAPTVILTLAIADSIHILLTMFHAMRHGMDKHAAIVESMRINMQPVFLTSITTVIGFLTMNFSEVPPFRDLGNIVAIGVTLAWLYSVFFLPAFMAVLPVRIKPVKTRTGQAMERLGDFVVAQRRPLFWGMAVLSIVLAAMISRNELNDEYVKYFDERVDFRTATDFAETRLTGTYQIHYSLNSGESGGISDPAYLNKTEAFANWYRTQPAVLHVNTITDTMKRLNKNMHNDDPAWYRLPEDRDLAAQYLLLYEMSLPYGLDLNDQINVGKSATRLVVTMKNVSTTEMLALEDRAQTWLNTNAPEMAAYGTSPALMFAHIGQRNIRSMISGNLLALVLVSAIMIIAIRSLRVGLVSLIPNIIPIAMAFGLWGLLVGRIGMATAVVTSLTFGIVVDDTIHFLSKYLHARREKGLVPEEAVRYAFATVGSAMWVTSVILIAGFSVLALSDFKLNSDMGILSAITIGFALLADYFLLPPLLMKMERKKS